jgi:hypothetical protein
MSNLIFLNVIAGISWEPEIRGALVVLVGATVLGGSVWLILTTNVGNRLGSLAALAGFFGWMTIMGLIWWIYGIGLTGDAPTWDPKELVYDFDEAITGDDVRAVGRIETVPASALVDEFCPGLVEATVVAQRARFLAGDPNIELDYDAPNEYCTEEIGEKLAVDGETIADQLTAANEALIERANETGVDDSRIKSPSELEEAIATEIRDEGVKLSQLTLSDLAAVSEDIIEDGEEAGLLDFKGWRLLSSGEAGEAIATADVAIIEATAFNSSAEFFVLDTFEKGGKPERSSDGVWDRLSNEIRNTVIFWHPKRTVVVTVAPTLDKEQTPGEAPPFAEIDPDGQPVSMVMVRDLGDLRLPAAITTIGSLIAFLGICLMLHLRDVELERRIEAWDPNAAT